MTTSMHEFLSLPLWLSIPLAAIYIGLVGYVVYILWQYRHRD